VNSGKFRSRRQKAGLAQAQLGGDSVLDFLTQCVLGDLLDDHAQEDRIRVRIFPACSGLEIEFFIESDTGKLDRGPHSFRLVEHPVREVLVFRVVGDAGGHVAQHRHSDPVGIGKFGEELGELVVQ